MHRPAITAPSRRARPLVALAAIGMIVLGACSSGATASPKAAPGVPLEGTPWQLGEYVGAGGRAVPVPASVIVTANLADGTISGNSGCNSYAGAYQVDGDKLQIGEIAGTKMACAGAAGTVESAYLQILGLVESYAISGETLEMRNGEGTITLRFEVTEAPALEGTTWAATGINTGTGVASLLADTKVTATFGEDGTVSGSSGCNTYSGSFSLDGDVIEVGELASTMMACADDVMQQETAYLAALRSAAVYVIANNVLELRDAEGALQVRYEVGAP